MVLAIAAESLFKLGRVAGVGFSRSPRSTVRRCVNTLRQLPQICGSRRCSSRRRSPRCSRFFCLPRQFHIGVVECADVATSAARGGGTAATSRAQLSSSFPSSPRRCRSTPPDARRADERRVGPVAAVVVRTGWLALLAYLGGFRAAPAW
jgi:hypothetical protein